MRAWQALLLVALLLVIGSGVLSFMNSQTLKKVQGEETTQQGYVDRLTRDITSATTEIEENKQAVASLETETQTAQTDLSTIQGTNSSLDLRIQTLRADNEAAETELKELEELIAVIGEIEQLDKTMQSRTAEVTMLEQELNSASNLLSVARAEKDDKDATIQAMEQEAKNRLTGRLTQDINAEVTAAYNDWQFVIIDAGDVDGLSPRSTLDVFRQGKPICKLIVTEVEPEKAVADIIPGSLLPGQIVQVGDTVSKKASPATQG